MNKINIVFFVVFIAIISFFAFRSWYRLYSTKKKLSTTTQNYGVREYYSGERIMNDKWSILDVQPMESTYHIEQSPLKFYIQTSKIDLAIEWIDKKNVSQDTEKIVTKFIYWVEMCLRDEILQSLTKSYGIKITTTDKRWKK